MNHFPTDGGSRYFVLFVYDYSRYTWIYLLQHQSELTDIYQNFHKMVQTQFSCTIKTFHSDNAMKYKDNSFLTILQQNGIVSHHCCPYTSQQNGLAERKHRHILDMIRTLLISAFFLEYF
jgi:transposase InsO family protein